MEREKLEQVSALFDKYDSIIAGYLIHLGFAILIFVIGRFMASFISRMVKRVMLRRNVETTLITFTTSLLRYAILAFTIIAVLGQLGVQTASIVAVIGAAGLAIGLALQGSLSNFAASVILIIFRPFKVGELVDIGILGTVRAIQIFSTTLSTPSGEIVIIPNSKVASGNIINYSREPQRRIDLVISVEYGANIIDVKRTLSEAVRNTAGILLEREPTIQLAELADSSLNFKVQAWAMNEDYGKARTELLERIKTGLDQNSINIPYPTLDINMKKAIPELLDSEKTEQI